MGQGSDLGHARGSITIDTSQAQRAPAVMRGVATDMERSFNRVSSSAQQMAGVFGVSLGVGVVAQMGRFVVEADKIATAYARQSVAAVNLAGSQGKLNDLLRVYGAATGGAVDKAASLANVTKLMAVGFADSAPELEKFARAIRGISIAMGVSQDTVTQNLILELFTQRGMRLDQLGLQYDKVKARSDELRAADASLTTQMAYQQAVLEQAEERFGALADSAEGAKTGIEHVTVAWTDLQLAIGQMGQGSLSGFFDFWARGLENTATALEEVDRKIQRSLWRLQGIDPNLMEFGISRGATDSARHPSRSTGVAGHVISQEERAIKIDWARGIKEVNQQMHADIIAEETSFGQQRSKTVADYNKSVAREERDFGRARLRAELDQLDAIADVWKDAARRESKAAADLARTIADAQSDSEERIVDAREDTTKRLIELEEDFQKDRERAAEEHRDTMLSAAGRLDAIALLEERKRWARENSDAKEAHSKQRDNLQEQLDERIEDENEALAKSIANAKEAHDRQLADAREADRLRIEDMKADFAQRKAREDEDRAIRNGDRAVDYAAQLAEMDTQHGLRLNQIRTNALREREALQLAADAALVAAQVADAATQKRHEAREKAEEKLWDDFHKHITNSLTIPRTMPGGPMKAYAKGGYVPQTGLAMLHAGEFVMPRQMVAAASGMGSSRSISVGDIHLSIMGTTNMGESQLRPLVRAVLIEALEEVAG